jgi:hypothetical protein
MQYQRLDSRTGRPLDDLVILKEWSSGNSERNIIERFKTLYLDRGIWNFIPIGNNLLYEFKFMKYKMKQYYGMEGLRLGQRPMIDLKHVMVIMNEGSFKGYRRILGKSGLAVNMAQ